MAVFRKVAYAQNQPQITSAQPKLLPGPTPAGAPKPVPPVKNPGLARRAGQAIWGGAKRMAGGSRIGAAGLLTTATVSSAAGGKKLVNGTTANSAKIQSPWMRTP